MLMIVRTASAISSGLVMTAGVIARHSSGDIAARVR